MRKRTALGLTILALGVIVIAGVWLLRGTIAVAVMRHVYDTAMGPDAVSALPDGLHVGLCGSGSPLPDPTRAGPCTVVVAGRDLFVIDSGSGSTKTLLLMNLPPPRVTAAFLTHFHSDHIADLGELMLQHWAGGAALKPLPIYGPPGVDRVVAGFEAAYALDEGYRIAHHGPKVVPTSGFGATARTFAISPLGPDVVVFRGPDLTVTAFPVDHGPVKPAVGYLFVYKGRRAVVSGDTAASPRLEEEARDADVLVHEGLAPNLVALQRDAALHHGRWNIAAILHDILSYHTTPEEAAAIAQRAHVRMLLFTHVIPPLPTPALNGPFLGRAPQVYKGLIRVGRDGDFISLPAGSAAIEQTNRMHALF
jgi:ribonuclease Z